eukprot:m.247999 g.247999  ORF g.247999 m.247999 type:complete len:702 (+) comp33863_c0_seq1:233-2338(+)
MSYPDVHSYIPRTGNQDVDDQIQLFAILRRFDTPPSKATELIWKAAASEAGVHAFDSVSGKYLIHFAVRTGTIGIGDEDKASALVAALIGKGARADTRCKHANLLPVHHAANLGCSKVIRELAKHNCGIDGLAPSLNGGTALHIACAALNIAGVLALIENEANPFIVNDHNHVPLKESEIMYENGSDSPLYDDKVLLQIINLLRTYMANTRDKFVSKTEDVFTTLDGMWRDKFGKFFNGGKVEIKSNGALAAQDGSDWLDGSGKVLHGSLVSLNFGDRIVVLKYHPSPNEKLVEFSHDGSDISGVCLVRMTKEEQEASTGVEVADLDGFWEDETETFANGRAIDIRADGSVLIDEGGNNMIQGTAVRQFDGSIKISVGGSEMYCKYDATQDKLIQWSPDGTALANPCVLAKANLDIADPKQSELEMIEVGDRVLINNKKIGIVRYKGETHFNPGVTLYGISLKHAEGKHNGTVGTRTYFRCRPNHGTFATRNKLKKLSAEAMEDLSAPAARKPARQVSKYGRQSGTFASMIEPAPFSSSTMAAKGKTVGVHGGVAKAPEHFQRRSIKLSPTRYESPLATTRRGLSRTYSSNKAEQDARRSRKSRHSMASTSPPIVAAESFQVGSKVLADKTEMGIVKYIGGVDFDEGIYIGIALTGPKAIAAGKHNGTVDGRRYFKTTSKVGVLLPASKVTWRGHRVSSLL